MNQDFKNALWATANKLRGSVDPSDYKYPVLGLIFLKYVSESFFARQEQLAAAFADPQNEFFIEDSGRHAAAMEDRDYYTMQNVFWVSEKARWPFLQANAKQSNIAVLLDDAMRLIEEDNPKLNNLLPKVYVRTALEPNTLGALVDLAASLQFTQAENGGDLLGDVYEYFLGRVLYYSANRQCDGRNIGAT
jgi:type I restriction enzyme M protein